MTTSTSHSHSHHSLPPSPPPSPSPPTSRRRNKKHHYHDDEFAKLAATPLPSPTLSSATFDDDDEPESLLRRLLLTPLLFTSFLLSLSLVNIQDRARRAAAHTPSTSYLTSLLPTSWLLSPEPYQDHTDSTWGRRGCGAEGHVEPNDAIAPKEGQLQLDGVGDGEADGGSGKKKKGKGRGRGNARRKRESWHLNKKIRKVARLEVSDAFEGQGRMMVWMCVVLGVGVVGVWVGMWWVWRGVVG